MAKRERVCLRRFEAAADSTEGKLFRYLNENPNLIPREAVLRSLRAFYLPWAVESQLDEQERQAAAKMAIQELQYRVFQIQQHFLPEELVLSFTLASSPAGQNSSSSSPTHNLPLPTTLGEMRQEVDSIDLEQFLDDF